MPELPDLQVFSRNLTKNLSGKTLKEIKVINDKKLNVSKAELKKSLELQKLKTIRRVGKELHFEFENGAVLSLHLMLHGQLFFFEKKNENKHTIIELIFEADKGLALTDFQAMATPTLNPEERETPDALSKQITFDFLKQQLQKVKGSIKAFLLDQHKIRGIGNAYADEILWHAAISPLSVCNKIPDDKIKDLAKSIPKVLLNAEKQILKTHPEIISGEVRDFLDIHNSKKRKSPTGGAIEQQMVNSRKTYFTSEQQLFK